MSETPKSADWRNFAHSVEVMAAAATAKCTLEIAPPDTLSLPAGAVSADWLSLAHSIDVLAASAAAQRDLQADWPTNTVSLASVRAVALQRSKPQSGWRHFSERPLMATISAVAAVLVIVAFATSSSGLFKRHGDPELAKGPTSSPSVGTQIASAELSASTQALMDRLRCRAGQDCWAAASGSSVIRSLGTDPARRPIVTGTTKGRDDIEARAQVGELPSADVEIPFAVNSAELPMAAKAQLDAIGETVKRSVGANGPSSFALIGDASPSEAEAETLAQRRATAVADYVISTFGIAARRIDAFGRGRVMPDRTGRSVPGSQRVRLVNLGHLSE